MTAEMWLRPLTCPAHGVLHRDEPARQWVCPGHPDGTPCRVTISDAQLSAGAGGGWEFLGLYREPVFGHQFAQLRRLDPDDLPPHPRPGTGEQR